MNIEVIVLNGGSSSGKSSIATCLQRRLDGTWVTLGIDDLIRALSHGPNDRGAGGTLEFGADGAIAVGEAFRRTQAAWYEGLAAIARAGTGLVVDEVFLDAAEAQRRLRSALRGLTVVWVGVRCDATVAHARELHRSDRIVGLARQQAERVHVGVSYDIEIDTTNTPADECAEAIVATITRCDS